MANILKVIDDFIWGIPLIVLILAVGVYLTVRLKGLQITKLLLAVKHMFAKNENGAEGETTSFGALCVALSATIGTGNIVGVAVTTKAFEQGLPFPNQVSAFILMLCLVFFAFTTILGWNYYSEKCVEYLVGDKPKVLKGYRWL